MMKNHAITSFIAYHPIQWPLFLSWEPIQGEITPDFNRESVPLFPGYSGQKVRTTEQASSALIVKCFKQLEGEGGQKGGKGDGEGGKKQKKKNSIEIRWSHFQEINKFNNILVNRVTLSSTGFCFLKKD